MPLPPAFAAAAVGQAVQATAQVSEGLIGKLIDAVDTQDEREYQLNLAACNHEAALLNKQLEAEVYQLKLKHENDMEKARMKSAQEKAALEAQYNFEMKKMEHQAELLKQYMTNIPQILDTQQHTFDRAADFFENQRASIDAYYNAQRENYQAQLEQYRLEQQKAYNEFNTGLYAHISDEIERLEKALAAIDKKFNKMNRRLTAAMQENKKALDNFSLNSIAGSNTDVRLLH